MTDPSSRSQRPKRSGPSHGEGKGRESVTLTEPFRGDYFPCPLCRGLLLVRETKSHKPYLRCDACGLQLFVRGKEGIRRLQALLASSQCVSSVQELNTVLDHFRLLKDRLREIEERFPLVGRDPDLELEEKLVRRELGKIREFLENELQGKKKEVKGAMKQGPNE